MKDVDVAVIAADVVMDAEADVVFSEAEAAAYG